MNLKTKSKLNETLELSVSTEDLISSITATQIHVFWTLNSKVRDVKLYQEVFAGGLVKRSTGVRLYRD